MFTFDVSWTRGKSDSEYETFGWTDRPYGIWPGLVFNGNVILKDTDRDFTLNSNWYDYDEESQYNSDGTKNGEYDKTFGDHHEDTASHDRALEKVLEYFDQGVYPDGYHRNSANNSDTPYTETGKHEHDIGHINGHSTVDYSPRPGETGYTPSTDDIKAPNFAAWDNYYGELVGEGPSPEQIRENVELQARGKPVDSYITESPWVGWDKYKQRLKDEGGLGGKLLTGPLGLGSPPVQGLEDAVRSVSVRLARCRAHHKKLFSNFFCHTALPRGGYHSAHQHRHCFSTDG